MSLKILCNYVLSHILSFINEDKKEMMKFLNKKEGKMFVYIHQYISYLNKIKIIIDLTKCNKSKAIFILNKNKNNLTKSIISLLLKEELSYRLFHLISFIMNHKCLTIEEGYLLLIDYENDFKRNIVKGISPDPIWEYFGIEDNYFFFEYFWNFDLIKSIKFQNEKKDVSITDELQIFINKIILFYFFLKRKKINLFY